MYQTFPDSSFQKMIVFAIKYQCIKVLGVSIFTISTGSDDLSLVQVRHVTNLKSQIRNTIKINYYVIIRLKLKVRLTNNSELFLKSIESRRSSRRNQGRNILDSLTFSYYFLWRKDLPRLYWIPCPLFWFLIIAPKNSDACPSQVAQNSFDPLRF